MRGRKSCGSLSCSGCGPAQGSNFEYEMVEEMLYDMAGDAENADDAITGIMTAASDDRFLREALVAAATRRKKREAK